MKIRPLTITEAEFIAHRLAFELMNSTTEPIPPFNTTDMGKLDSSLATPFQTFDGKYLYVRFETRAALLFYLIAKNHCFGNGNKRMAVTLTTVFCFVNRRWIDIPPLELYDLACSVAVSDPKNMEKEHQMLTVLFKAHITQLNNKYPVGDRK